MTGRIERIATSVLVLSAIVVSVAAVRVAFFPTSTAAELKPFSYVDEWDELVEAGLLIGRADAPVKILEFGDLECPFCRRFHGTLQEARHEFGPEVAFVFVHYPLERHEHAWPAALGAECANAQGRFAEYLDIIYTQQDSLGTVQWTSVATKAGVPDTLAFSRCMAQETGRDAVDRGRELGRRIGVAGTPTVLVNGWLLRPIPYDTLSGVVDRALRGLEPFDRAVR